MICNFKVLLFSFIAISLVATPTLAENPRPGSKRAIVFFTDGQPSSGEAGDIFSYSTRSVSEDSEVVCVGEQETLANGMSRREEFCKTVKGSDNAWDVLADIYLELYGELP